MDLLTLAAIMWRRWYVVLPVLIAASMLGMILIGQPAIRYETYSTELLVVRDQVDQTADGTPTLSVFQVSSVLAGALRQPEFVASLREDGFDGSIDTSVSPDGGVVVVTVTASSPDDVVQTLRAVADRAPGALDAAVGTTTADSVEVAPLSEASENDIVETNGNYSATANIAVLSLADQRNPFQPGGGTILMLTEISQGYQVANELLLAVPSAEFDVNGDGARTAPLIRITTTADTSDEAIQAIDVVRDQLNLQLAALQSSAGVSNGNQTVLQTLVPAADAERTSASRVRSAAGAALLGLAAACLAAITFDARTFRRRARRLPQQKRPEEL